MKRTAALLLLTLAIAGCGKRDGLVPKPGAAMPVKPEAARETPNVGDLLALPPGVRPGRSDELIHRSEERPDDRFDLPPPG